MLSHPGLAVGVAGTTAGMSRVGDNEADLGSGVDSFGRVGDVGAGGEPSAAGSLEDSGASPIAPVTFVTISATGESMPEIPPFSIRLDATGG